MHMKFHIKDTNGVYVIVELKFHHLKSKRVGTLIEQIYTKDNTRLSFGFIKFFNVAWNYNVQRDVSCFISMLKNNTAYRYDKIEFNNDSCIPFTAKELLIISGFLEKHNTP